MNNSPGWLKRMFQGTKTARSRPRRVRLNLEALEDRTTPAALFPNVRSIAFATPAEQFTNAISVTYAVTFNESVEHVHASDFQVVTTGAVQATSPVVVSGSGSSYSVTVNGIHGDGTLQLDLIDTDTIDDSATGLLPLGGAGDYNGSFQGQTYSILQTDPSVVSIDRTTASAAVVGPTSVSYAVTFSQAVTGVVPSDFALNLSGVTASTPVAVTGSGSVYTVTVNGISGSGTLGLSLVDNGSIEDLAGNPLTAVNAPAAFQAQQSFAAGAAPSAVVFGDLTGDGNQDMVVVNSTSGTVSVLLGNGNGTFQAQQTYAVHSGPDSVALGDVNGDGIPDLVVANSGSGSVSVLLGNGNGTFQTQHSFAVGAGPSFVALGDVNGDGDLDIIAANEDQGTVSVLLGNGDGTFQAQKTFAVGAAPTSVAVGDVNGDGNADLVVANSSDNTVSVLLGNGDGRFQAQQTFATGASPSSVALGDVNGDGNADIAVANLGSNTVSVLLGNGNGAFQAQQTFATGAGPNSVALGDVNGDGNLDLAVANFGSNTMSVLLGNGNGAFQAQRTFATGDEPSSVALGDVNGDGKLDLAVANQNSSSVSVLQNSVLGNFTGQVYTVLLPLANPTVVSHGSNALISLSSLDPTPTGTVHYTVTMADPLQSLNLQYGLTLHDGLFNDRGQDEKYLLSTNGSNPNQGGWYVLMPTGALYRYIADAANDLNATLAKPPLATLSPSVWANPLLLTRNDGVPIVTAADNPLDDLKVQYGLVATPTYDKFGADEWDLQSSNGSNKAGGGLYVLMPNNELYASGATLGDNQLVANFNLAPYSTNVYANTSLLTGASLPTRTGVTASASSNFGGELILTTQPGFDRSVSITVTANDSAHTFTQTFTFTVSDVTPSIAPVANLTVNHNSSVPAVQLTVTDPDPDASERSYSVSVSTYNPLYDIQAQYGLNESDETQYYDERGQDEKYFQSTNGSNPAGNYFYVLMPTDKLYKYVTDAGNDLNDTVVPANLVADFTQAPYSPTGNVYNTTALLYAAAAPTSPTVAVNRGPLDDVQTQFGLTIASNPANNNLRGANEKYLLSANGSNAAGSGWYVLMPTDQLYAWDGVSIATTIANAPVADFTQAQYAAAGNVWAEPSLLTSAQPAYVNAPVFNVKQMYGLNTAAQDFDKRGQSEEYFKSGNGSNAANGGWYVLMPNDELYAYVKDAKNNLNATLANPPVFNFTPYGNVYAAPALLYASTDQAAAVTAAISPSGVITLTPNIAFTGTVRVTATVSDGAESGTRSFLFTVNDNAPTLQPVSAVTASSAAGSTTVSYSASTFNGAAVLPAASISGYNPLYDVQQLYGLTSAPFMSDANGLYLKSNNGSNPAFGNEYLLATNDMLYAWKGSAGATLGVMAVADFTSATYAPYGGANVYANPALLYAATRPAAPSIATSFPSAGSLLLTWPSGYTGTFRVTLDVGDGALETEQTFLVTVS